MTIAGKIPLEALLAAPTKIDSIGLAFTNKCNLRCTYCPEGTHPPDFYADLASADMSLVLDAIKESKAEKIWLGVYGEFTFHSEWHIYTQKLFDLGLAVSGVTNLAHTLKPEEVATFSRFSEIFVSIDTSDPKTLKEIRKAVDVRTIVYNVQAIKAFSLEQNTPIPKFTWSCVLTDKVILQTKGLIALAVACGADTVSFNSMCDYKGVTGGCRNIADLEGTELLDAVRALNEALLFAQQHQINVTLHGLDTIQSALRRLESGSKEPSYHLEESVGIHGVPVNYRAYDNDADHKGLTKHCFDPWSIAFIDQRKNVFPCCNLGTVMGTISEDTSLAQILDGEKYRELRKSLLDGNLGVGCKHCWMKNNIDVDTFAEKLEDFVDSRSQEAS